MLKGQEHGGPEDAPKTPQSQGRNPPNALPTTPSQDPGTVRGTFLTLRGAYYLGRNAKGKR